MGSLSTESFDEFLDSLKRAGITISNERELRERLEEAQQWRYAFMTLASNGRPIGIRFEMNGHEVSDEVLHSAFSRFQFPERSEALFTRNLKSAH